MQLGEKRSKALYLVSPEGILKKLPVGKFCYIKILCEICNSMARMKQYTNSCSSSISKAMHPLLNTAVKQLVALTDIHQSHAPILNTAVKPCPTIKYSCKAMHPY